MKSKLLTWRPTTRVIMLAVVLIVLSFSVSADSATDLRPPKATQTQVPTETFPSTLEPTPKAAPVVPQVSEQALASVSDIQVPKSVPTQQVPTTPATPTPVATEVGSLMCAQSQGTSVKIGGEDVPLHEALCVMSLDEGIVRVQLAGGLSWVGIRQSDGQSVGGILLLEESHLWGHFRSILGMELIAMPLPLPNSASVVPSGQSITALPASSPTVTPIAGPDPTTSPVPTAVPVSAVTPTQIPVPAPTADAPAPTAVPDSEATPVPTAVPVPTVLPTQTAAPVPTVMPAPTAEPVPKATPVPTAVPVPTALPTRTAVPVPTSAPDPTSVPIPNVPSGSDECAPGQVDINSATVGELVQIKHIGSVRAAQIIELRPFSSVDDLTRVKGIAEKRLADIKEQGLACAGG